jgi:hypothetical protein
MENRFLLFLFFVSQLVYSQTIIKGTVYQVNGPLEGAAVYLNNTMLGTTTDANGEFSFPVKSGQYEMIISYLGYKKTIYSLNTSNYTKPLVFALEEAKNTLDEIIIKKTVYDDEWKYNFTAFKRAFIGQSKLAEECEILNPEALHFNFDANKNILNAYARKPLQIQHKGLGYKITYELETFTINNSLVTYLGYSRYQKLKGNKRKERKWKKNRLITFNGSPMHFYRTLLTNSTYKDGFLLHLFKRVPNPERPTEAELQKAREIVRLNLSRNKNVNFSASIAAPKTAFDSARVVLNKQKLPKFKDNIYKSKAPVSDIVLKENSSTYLNIEHNVLVVYTKEKEERKYIMRNAFSKIREAYPQSSSIIPLKKPTAIDINGLLVNPLHVYYEGYWSFEKFGNALPIDYKPQKK